MGSMTKSKRKSKPLRKRASTPAKTVDKVERIFEGTEFTKGNLVKIVAYIGEEFREYNLNYKTLTEIQSHLVDLLMVEHCDFYILRMLKRLGDHSKLKISNECIADLLINSTPIQDLGISSESVQLLQKCNIYTIGQLCMNSEVLLMDLEMDWGEIKTLNAALKDRKRYLKAV